MSKTLTKKPSDGTMSLGGHMKELRNRLFVVAAVFVAATVFTLTRAAVVVDKLLQMATSVEAGELYNFVVISPQERLLQYFRISLIAAAVVTIPVALYEIWAFAKPGLKKSEYRFFGAALAMGLVLFAVGVLFAYFVTLPFMLNFLATVGQSETTADLINISSNISIAEYIGFVLTIFIIFGAVFEMPLLSVVLAKLGIANPDIMRKGRGVAIVICFVLAAIITPPDIVSQILVAIPMVLLYQISIWLAGVFYKPKKDEDDEDDEEEEEEDDED